MLKIVVHIVTTALQRITTFEIPAFVTQHL
jgi:hypothetical protein